jgi:hypothetical protein
MIRELLLFLGKIFARRNFLLSLVVVAVAACLLALRYFGTAGLGLFVARHLGYWLCLALLLSFLYLWVLLYLNQGRRLRARVAPHAKALLVSLGLGALWMVHEPWVDRVLFDEYVFLGISHQMHQVREAMNPAKAHLIDESVRVLASVPDKRSYLFPFLVSVIHDLTGFRPQNLYLLNTFFGLGILPLAYFTLSAFFPARVALAGVVLWSAFGLLPAHANAAGYDIVNLFFLQLWLLLAVLAVKGGTARWWDLFVVASICLALLRNESVFFLVGTLAIGFLRYRVRRVVRLSWPVIAATLALVIPVAANLNFSNLEGLRENTKNQAFFSLSYFGDNVLSSLHFILSPALKAPNQPLLGLVGLVSGVLFAVRYLGRCSRREPISPAERVLFVFSGCVAMCYILYMCTFWGDWNDPMVSRFSIPIYFWFLVVTCWLLTWARSKPRLRQLPNLMLAGAAVFAFARMPAQTQLAYTGRFQVGREMEFLKAKIAEKTGSRVFLVTNGISGFISRGIPGVWATGFGAHTWRVQALLDYNLYDEILIADRFLLDPATGAWRPDRMQPEPEEISWFYGNKFELELLDEYRSSWVSSFRIYRLKAVVDVDEARRQREQHIRDNHLADKDYIVRLMHLLP